MGAPPLLPLAELRPLATTGIRRQPAALGQGHAATADEVEAAVARCPSGALRTRRIGVPTAPRRQPLELCASADGPLLISGGVRILDAEGRVLYEGERAALCRCGGSANKPFCDGTHKKNGFHG